MMLGVASYQEALRTLGRLADQAGRLSILEHTEWGFVEVGTPDAACEFDAVELEAIVIASVAQRGWHQTGGRLRVPDNITLLPLPSYSPELNPMENVWNYLRSNKLCSLLWDSYEAIVDACTGAWHFLINDPERIRSIGSRIWARVTL